MSRAFSQAKLKGEERERGLLHLPSTGEQRSRRRSPPSSARREQTIRYYSLEGIVREVVRTTSRLERTNRELRRKVRQVGVCWRRADRHLKVLFPSDAPAVDMEDFGSSRSAEQFL